VAECTAAPIARHSGGFHFNDFWDFDRHDGSFALGGRMIAGAPVTATFAARPARDKFALWFG